MNSRTRLTILTIIISVLHLTAFTQQGTGNISGAVFTNEGKAAPAVSINIRHTNYSAVSDSNGNFIFTSIPAGNYVITTVSVNLQSQFKNVQVKQGENIVVKFLLNETQTELEEVSVTGIKGANDKAATIGKTNIAQRDLPQAITIINKSVLERQQSNSMSDVLQNANGVYIMGTTAGTQEEIAGRGYAFSSSNTFKNGVRYNNSIRPEISSLEKVELLKGGSALLYGNVAAGGVLNLVTRKPKFQQGGSISFRTGSNGFYKPSFDVYGPVNNSKKLAYRFNGTYEAAKSFRNYVSGERIYVNPSLLYRISPKTNILVESDFLKDERTPDYGTGAINYVVANNGRNTFLNVPWAYNKTNQSTITTTATHSFTDKLQLTAIAAYQQYDNEIFGANRPNAASQMVSANGTWIRSLTKGATNENYYYGSVDLSASIKLFSLEHKLLFGLDADKYKTISTAFANYANALVGNKNIYDTINIFNPIFKRVDIPSVAIDRITTTPVQRTGIYMQDHITLNSKLKVLAGIRYTRQENLAATVDTLSKNKTGLINAFTSSAFSPKAGIVFQPTKKTSLFASYSNSFNVNSGTDINNEPLKPSIIDQYELGIKNDLFNSLLSANITLYQINNSNLLQAVINPPAGTPNAKELTGATVSRGVEVDVVSKPVHGFNIIAGYSFNDMRYMRSKEFIEDTRLRYNPAHTANASIYYTVKENSKLKGLNAGLGFFYTGDRLAGRSTTVARPDYKLMTLPDFTTVDVNLGYSISNISLRLKVSNLLNTLSYYAHDDNSVNPIAPTQFAATMSYKF
jgi:iron complex outermembrane receptor protein